VLLLLVRARLTDHAGAPGRQETAVEGCCPHAKYTHTHTHTHTRTHRRA
jgi:hypothetical protein